MHRTHLQWNYTSPCYSTWNRTSSWSLHALLPPPAPAPFLFLYTFILDPCACDSDVAGVPMQAVSHRTAALSCQICQRYALSRWICQRYALCRRSGRNVLVSCQLVTAILVHLPPDCANLPCSKLWGRFNSVKPLWHIVLTIAYSSFLLGNILWRNSNFGYYVQT